MEQDLDIEDLHVYEKTIMDNEVFMGSILFVNGDVSMDENVDIKRSYMCTKNKYTR